MIYFTTGGDKKAEAMQIMDTMIPFIKSQKGCTDCLFLMHDGDGRYASLVFWDSKENADAAAGIIGPKLIPALNKIATEPVSPVLFQVYQTL
jgi:hypothetical protein